MKLNLLSDDEIRQLTHAQAIARCEAINARIGELDDSENLSRSEQREFRALADEFDACNDQRKRLERKAALASGFGGVRLEPGTDGTRDDQQPKQQRTG